MRMLVLSSQEKKEILRPIETPAKRSGIHFLHARRASTGKAAPGAGRDGSRAIDRKVEIVRVDIGADEADAEACAGDRGASEPRERVHGQLDARDPVQQETLFRALRR